MTEDRIIGTEEMAEIYGCKNRQAFNAWKYRNPHKVPEPVSRGKWMHSDVIHHLTTQAWKRKKAGRPRKIAQGEVVVRL